MYVFCLAAMDASHLTIFFYGAGFTSDAFDEYMRLISVLGLASGGCKKTGFHSPDGPLMKHAVRCYK